MNARHSVIVARIEELIARNRDRDGRPVREEIDELYTDACAMALALESERMDIDRRLRGARNGTSPGDLSRRGAEIARELRELRELIAHLSTAAEWMREPESAEIDDLLD